MINSLDMLFASMTVTSIAMTAAFGLHLRGVSYAHRDLQEKYSDMKEMIVSEPAVPDLTKFTPGKTVSVEHMNKWGAINQSFWYGKDRSLVEARVGDTIMLIDCPNATINRWGDGIILAIRYSTRGMMSGVS